MATTAQVSTQRSTAEICKRVFVPLFFAAGFLLRLRLAWLTFLNPDEALHYFLSRQPSLKLAYEASLTTAHPPMMILLLHYWSLVGRSEFFLRLPFVAAGIVFCWVVFLWVREVAGMRGLGLRAQWPCSRRRLSRSRLKSGSIPSCFFFACVLFIFSNVLSTKSRSNPSCSPQGFSTSPCLRITRRSSLLSRQECTDYFV